MYPLKGNIIRCKWLWSIAGEGEEEESARTSYRWGMLIEPFSLSPAHLTVLHQAYKMQVYDEFVIRENMAIMRCHVPSIVREYVHVVSWLRDDQVLVTASHNPRKCRQFDYLLNEQFHLFCVTPCCPNLPAHFAAYTLISRFGIYILS